MIFNSLLFCKMLRFFKRLSSTHKSFNPKPIKQPFWETESSTRLLIVGASLILIPAFWTLTEEYKVSPKESHYKHVLQHTHDAVESILDTADSDSKPKSESSQTNSQPISTSISSKLKSYHATYLLIGAGTASISALSVLKETPPDASILVISNDINCPYPKPPLSKDAWDSPENIDLIKYSTNLEVASLDTLGNSKSQILFGTVTSIDVGNNTVQLDSGLIVSFDKLLVATGSSPLKHPLFKNTFNTMTDFKQLASIGKSQKIILFGGGFLGTELSQAIKKAGYSVSLMVEEGCLDTILPQYLSLYLTEKIISEGIDIIPNSTLIKSVTESDNNVSIDLLDGRTISGDKAISCIGTSPNIDLAKHNLEIDSNTYGILVNSQLSATKNIFAAGDVASFYDLSSGTRKRIDHYANAVSSGKIAGLNMAGGDYSYSHTAKWWSFGPGMSFEGVGNVKRGMKTIGVFDETGGFEKGVVYYLSDDDILEGIIIWNIPGQLDVATRLVEKRKKVDDVASLTRNFKFY